MKLAIKGFRKVILPNKLKYLEVNKQLKKAGIANS